MIKQVTDMLMTSANSDVAGIFAHQPLATNRKLPQVIKKITILLIAVSLLASCQSFSVSKNEDKKATASTESISVTPSSKKEKKPQSNDGAYYLDDGPPNDDEKLALISETNDAVVKHKPINPKRNRPYNALGKRYTPYQELTPYKNQGVASWYGRRYHGRKTSSGDIYDMYQMTAAHTILPIPSFARVTHVKSKKSIIVKINDRGPFLNNRIIDLSFAAATKLGIVNSGVGEVIVESILPESYNKIVPEVEKLIEFPRIENIPETNEKNLYIQFGAFESHKNAIEYANQVHSDITWANQSFSEVSINKIADGLYKVRIGPFKTREIAAMSDRKICAEYNYCGFIVSQ